MPEYPDLTIYVEALDRFIRGRVLEGVDLASASLLRTVDPPLSDAVGRRVTGVRRHSNAETETSWTGPSWG